MRLAIARRRLVDAKFGKRIGSLMHAGILLECRLEVRHRIGGASAIHEQLAEVEVRFGRIVHGRQVGQRPLILTHFYEHRGRVVAVQRLIWLQVNRLFENLQRRLQFAFARQAQTEVVQRGRVLRIGASLLVDTSFRPAANCFGGLPCGRRREARRHYQATSKVPAANSDEPAADRLAARTFARRR